MNFKDTVKKDIQNTFINLDEFADKINLDGHICAGVFTDVSQEDSSLMELYGSTKVLHISSGDIKKVYKPNSAITINNKHYKINKIDTNAGLYSIYIGVEGR